MPGLVPGIHVSHSSNQKSRGSPDKPGHDGVGADFFEFRSSIEG